jgi:hypothetical protein
MSYTDREEEIKDIIREYYDSSVKGSDLKRLWFVFREVTHAYVNIPVEMLKPYLGQKWGYAVGHVIAYSGYLVGAYAVSAITVFLNNAVFKLLGLF